MTKKQLVFLPGMLCTELVFQQQVQDLTDIASAQVIPLNEGESISESARWILEQCPQEFVLVGFSQGAVVALEILRQAPERVHKLCLMAADARGSSERQLMLWQSWRDHAYSSEFHNYVEAFSQNIFKQDDLEVKNIIKDMAYRAGRDSFVRQLKALSSRTDSRPTLTDIYCPSLLLAGRQDKLTPLKLSLEIAEALPEATLIPIEDCGHYLPLEQPQAVSALLRYFLAT